MKRNNKNNIINTVLMIVSGLIAIAAVFGITYLILSSDLPDWAKVILLR